MTLVAIAIVGVLMAAVGNLVIGHYARARTDQDAAKALNLAEAALNFQIQKISSNVNSTQTQYNGSSTDATGNANSATYGVDGNRLPVHKLDASKAYFSTTSIPPVISTSDYVQAWVDGPLNLYATTPQDIYGEATVNGARRRVRAKGGSIGEDDQFALYAMYNLQLGGNATIIGSAGAGNELTVGGSASASGGYVLNNYASGDPAPAVSPLMLNSLAPPFDTIYTKANRLATQYKNRTLQPTLVDTAYPSYKDTISTTKGIQNFQTSNDNSSVTGWPSVNNNNNNLLSNVTLNLVGKPAGTNLYLRRLDGANATIIADVSNGPVNLWVESTSQDTLSGSTYIGVKTGQEALVGRFHVYYSNTANAKGLTLTGGGNPKPSGPTPTKVNIQAMIYAYDQDYDNSGNLTSTTKYVGSVDMQGNIEVYGSVKAWDMEDKNDSISGSVKITFPSGMSGVSAGEGILYYGIKSPWQEVDPVRGVTP